MIKLALATLRRGPSLTVAPRYCISNWKLPAFEVDAAGISGFF